MKHNHRLYRISGTVGLGILIFFMTYTIGALPKHPSKTQAVIQTGENDKKITTAETTTPFVQKHICVCCAARRAKFQKHVEQARAHRQAKQANASINTP